MAEGLLPDQRHSASGQETASRERNVHPRNRPLLPRAAGRTEGTGTCRPTTRRPDWAICSDTESQLMHAPMLTELHSAVDRLPQVLSPRPAQAVSSTHTCTRTLWPARRSDAASLLPLQPVYRTQLT